MRQEFESLSKTTHPADWLAAEYKNRRGQNPSYSLRAFAKRIDIPVGRLTEILSRKRNLTLSLAEKISDRLEYSPRIKSQLNSLLKGSDSKKPKKKSKTVFGDSIRFKELEADSFHLISEWYHYGILNLTEVEGFTLEAKVIAQRLGITATEVRVAIERLKRLGMLKDENGSLVRSEKRLTTSVDIPSSAIRSSHRERLKLAINAIESVPVSERDFSTIMFASSPEFLVEAKKRTQKFRRSLLALASEFKKTQVFTVNVQIFPISNKEV